jgi:ATP-dependent RNA helicase RhlE
MPNIPETYVHRIGRTARAGADGVAISFVDADETAYLRDIERLIRQTLPRENRRIGNPDARSEDRPAGARHAQPQQRSRDGRRGHGHGHAHGHGHGHGQRHQGGRTEQPAEHSRGNHGQHGHHRPNRDGAGQSSRPQATGSAPHDGIHGVGFMKRSHKRSHQRPAGGGNGQRQNLEKHVRSDGRANAGRRPQR